VRKMVIFVLVVILVFVVGCAKEVQKEVSVTKTPVSPVSNPVVNQAPVSSEPVKEVKVENSSSQLPSDIKPAVEVKAPEFVSDVSCSPGSFMFKVTNLGDEKLSASRISMIIAGKPFYPTCDVEVLEPGMLSSCFVTSYIKGKFSVKIEAELFNNSRSFIERYFNNTISCSEVG
jgi:hypothetical protein